MSVNFCQSLRVHFDGGSRRSYSYHSRNTSNSQNWRIRIWQQTTRILIQILWATSPCCGPNAIAVVQRLQTQIDSSDG